MGIAPLGNVALMMNHMDAERVNLPAQGLQNGSGLPVTQREQPLATAHRKGALIHERAHGRPVATFETGLYESLCPRKQINRPINHCINPRITSLENHSAPNRRKKARLARPRRLRQPLP